MGVVLVAAALTRLVLPTRRAGFGRLTTLSGDGDRSARSADQRGDGQDRCDSRSHESQPPLLSSGPSHDLLLDLI